MGYPWVPYLSVSTFQWFIGKPEGEDGLRGLHKAMRGNIHTILATVATGVFAILYFASRSQLDALTVEDGLLENLTALLYFLAAILFVMGIRKRTSGPVWLALLAVASIFVAGEEISWGQRIFGWATPDGIAVINVQDETTIHNITGIHENIRAFALVFVAAFCVMLPVSNRLVPALRHFYERWRIPIFPMSAVPWVVMAIGFMLMPRLLGDHVGALDEVGETALGLAFSLFGAAYATSPTTPEHVPAAGANDPSEFQQAS